MSDQPEHDDTESPAPAPAEASGPPTAEQERDALQDRLLRTAAEFDNYRKRVDR
jgi:molecular chaperone GrpE (heat shock protein)